MAATVKKFGWTHQYALFFLKALGLRCLKQLPQKKDRKTPPTGRKTFRKWERRGASFARRTTNHGSQHTMRNPGQGVYLRCSQACDSCGSPQIQRGISLDCIHKSPRVSNKCVNSITLRALNRRVPDVRQLTMYSKSVMWSGQEAGGVVGLSADDGRQAGDPTDRAAPAPGSDQVCRAVTKGSTPAVATARAPRLGMEWG